MTFVIQSACTLEQRYMFKQRERERERGTMPGVLCKVSHHYLAENIKARQVTAGILLLEMQTGHIGLSIPTNHPA